MHLFREEFEFGGGTESPSIQRTIYILCSSIVCYLLVHYSSTIRLHLFQKHCYERTNKF
ncbi:hypothetical protein X975_17272, partial [Stegodyphus mimosarum]